MSKKDENLVIIDADSLVYIIGYELSMMQLEPLGIIKLDEFIKNILVACGAKNYIGYFGGSCGTNFRYKVAVTKPYKGNRPDKEDWYKFWEPILKDRMRDYWKFEPVCNIEADDACSIAAVQYKGKYSKVIVASPDKDLFQIPDTWFYNYSKISTVYCNEEVAMTKLCTQLITGDTSDNIAGCIGAGPKVANDFILEFITDKVKDESTMLDEVKRFYVKWYTEVLRDKMLKKEEKEYLAQYKIDNDIKRLTGNLKSDALAKFVPKLEGIKTKKEAMAMFTEMFTLLKLLDTKKDGAKHGFKLTKPIVDTRVKWDEIIQYQHELDEILEEDIIDEDFLKLL